MTGDSVSGYRLSPRQRYLWPLGRVVQARAGRAGALSETKLEWALQKLIARHEILRTRFRAVPELRFPLQIIQEDFPGPVLRRVDLRDTGPASLEKAIESEAAADRETPFELEEGRPVRFTLLKIAPENHILLVTLPALCADAASLPTIFKETARLYDRDELEEPVQFIQVSEWQNETLAEGGETAEKAGEFWQAQGAGPRLRLPLQLTATATGPAHPAHFEQVLPVGLVTALEALAAKFDLPLAELLFTTWQVFLAHLSGEKIFSLSYETSGREFEEMTGVIGPVGGILPVKLSLEPEFSFAEVWQETARKVRQVREGQDYYDPELIPGKWLEFAFSFQEIALGGFTSYRETSPGERFSLKLVCLWEAESARLDWRYTESEFERLEIERLAGQFLLLVQTITADPQTPVGKLNLISPAEARDQTLTWNATAKKFGPVGAIHSLFEEQARQHPAATAVIFEGEALSYAELNRQANKMAHYLLRLGVGPEKVVGICLERSVEMLVALLAVLKAGGAYLPLDPRFPPERLAFMLDDAGAEVVLTQQALLPPVSRPVALCLYSDEAAWSPEAEDNPKLNLQPENIAYVIYTSGSTGQPKGVLVEHRQLTNYTLAALEKLALPAGANYAIVSTIAADLGNTVIYPALCSGGCLHVISWDQMFDSTALAAYFERNRIDCLKIVPSHLAVLLTGPHPAKLLPRSCLVLGGESWEAELGRKLQSLAPTCRIYNHYGPTETTVGVLTYRLEDTGLPPYALKPPLGRPLANLRVYILDENLQPVAVGLPGEIYIGGVGVTRGYLKRPDLTAEKFLPDPYNPAGGCRMYRTGDQARFLPGGQIEFLGRTDNQVKVRGFRVELGEIEQALRNMAPVREALAVFRNDRMLVAYLVAQEGWLKSHEEQLYTGQIQEWQQVFNETHGALQARPGLTFNSFGWNSSYTGEPMREAEIRQQVEFTAQAVLDHQPERVLEIGCGTGLLLFQIAPHCLEYWGTDFSRPILDYTRQALAGAGLENVRLLQQEATGFQNLPEGYFDAIILNSVIQYFPGVDYLLELIRRAVKLVKPGGFLFLGDIRSLALQEAFHASVQFERNGPAIPKGQLAEQVRQQMGRESELLLEPAFFQVLPKDQPAITGVEISLKRGTFQNELTAFRYNVVLQIKGEQADPLTVEWRDWQRDNLNLHGVRALLQQTPWKPVGLRGIPNSRVRTACGLVRWMAGPGLTPFSEEALPPAVDPEELWSLGEELGRQAHLEFSTSPDSVDALFFPAQSSKPALVSNRPNRGHLARPINSFANFPLQQKLATQIGTELRPVLEKLLPDYMLPNHFVLLREIPLNQNGKVDYEALPLPLAGQVGMGRPYQAPRNPVEEVVAATWAEVLHFEKVGINDNFFELGGHSLLATQAVARLRAIFQVALPLKAFFEDPTVAGIARSMVLDQEKPGQIERIAEIWQRINRMSPEEVHAMLQRQKQTQAGSK
jgi:amino acid adenylation domain-containing protein